LSNFKYRTGICETCPHNNWTLTKTTEQDEKTLTERTLFVEEWVCEAGQIFRWTNIQGESRKREPFPKWQCPKHPRFPDVGESKVVWSIPPGYDPKNIGVSINPASGTIGVFLYSKSIDNIAVVYDFNGFVTILDSKGKIIASFSGSDEYGGEVRGCYKISHSCEKKGDYYKFYHEIYIAYSPDTL